ncbi:MAG: hypothetical protein ACPGU5_08450 [Lishizhenia sp.]
MLFRNWVGLAFVLFGLLLPYPIYSLSIENCILFPLIEPFLLFLLELFWEFEPKIISGYSDGKILYLLFVICFVFSAILLIINQFRFKTSTEKIYTLCCQFLIYISAFFLFKYGFDKVIGTQFPIPEGNLLETQLKNLDKDILFWSAMSGSKLYIQFMGWIEIIPAFLILFERTRKFGLILSLGVLTNILFVNLGFNITVKLVSFYLLAVVLFLLSFYWKSIKPIIFSENQFVKTELPSLISNKKLRYTFTSLIVFVFLFESIKPHLHQNESSDNFKSYSFKENSLYTFLEVENVKNIHIHSDHFLILEKHTQNNEKQFESFPVQIRTQKFSTEFFIPSINKQFKIINQKKLQLSSENDTIELKEINYSKSAFFNDNFYLFLEDFLDEE